MPSVRLIIPTRNAGMNCAMNMVYMSSMRPILKLMVCNSMKKATGILLMTALGQPNGLTAEREWLKGIRINPVLLCGPWAMKQVMGPTLSSYTIG